MKTNKKTILLVEDNRLVFSIYLAWLQRYGFKVEGAEDGEVALKKLPKLLPDLVILDWRLPKLSGLEVLKFIRAHPDLKTTPVMILSDAYLDESAVQVMSVGVTKQLLKTQCTPSILVELVRALLRLVPPPGWQSAGYPLPADADVRTVGESGACVNGQSCREYFAGIREESLAFAKEVGSPAGVEHLKNLRQYVRSVSVRASQEGFTKIARLASALEAMLSEINLKEMPPTPSALQTIAQTVDCLARLFLKGGLNSVAVYSAARVLVVDDDPICNLAATTAMKHAKLEAVSTCDPQAALEMARDGHYDVVLLDINMPGTNGFEVCAKLRAWPQYKKTPVIFVTSNNDFQNRAQAVLCGGNDLIAKPILPQELALKVIMRLTESLEQPANKTPVSKAVHLAVAPGNGRLVMAKNEQSGTATNGHTARTTAGSVGSHHRPSQHTESAAPSRLTFNPSSFHRASPPVNGANRGRPVEYGNGDDPFNKVTREIARIEASPTSRFVPAGNGRNYKKPVKDRPENEPLDNITREITRILLGKDQMPEAYLHLTRIALENFLVPEIIHQTLDLDVPADGAPAARAEEPPFDQIARAVARIIFDDDDVSDLQLRLTRMALERHRVPDIISPGFLANGRLPGTKPAADELASIRKDFEDIKATFAARQKSTGLVSLNDVAADTDLAEEVKSKKPVLAA
jgi:DNA-binding response OmpR family regulator